MPALDTWFTASTRLSLPWLSHHSIHIYPLHSGHHVYSAQTYHGGNMCCQLDHTTTKTRLIIASPVISFTDAYFHSGYLATFVCRVAALILISSIVLSHFAPVILRYYQSSYSVVSLFFTYIPPLPCHHFPSLSTPYSYCYHHFPSCLVSLPFVVLTSSTSRLYDR